MTLFNRIHSLPLISRATIAVVALAVESVLMVLLILLALYGGLGLVGLVIAAVAACLCALVCSAAIGRYGLFLVPVLFLVATSLLLWWVGALDTCYDCREHATGVGLIRVVAVIVAIIVLPTAFIGERLSTGKWFFFSKRTSRPA